MKNATEVQRLLNNGLGEDAGKRWFDHLSDESITPEQRILMLLERPLSAFGANAQAVSRAMVVGFPCLAEKFVDHVIQLEAQHQNWEDSEGDTNLKRYRFQYCIIGLIEGAVWLLKNHDGRRALYRIQVTVLGKVAELLKSATWMLACCPLMDERNAGAFSNCVAEYIRELPESQLKVLATFLRSLSEFHNGVLDNGGKPSPFLNQITIEFKFKAISLLKTDAGLRLIASAVDEKASQSRDGCFIVNE